MCNGLHGTNIPLCCILVTGGFMTAWSRCIKECINSSVSPDIIFRLHYSVFLSGKYVFRLCNLNMYVTGVQCPQYVPVNLDDHGWVIFGSRGKFQEWITPRILIKDISPSGNLCSKLCIRLLCCLSAMNWTDCHRLKILFLGSIQDVCTILASPAN